jgi:hypothetical protein
MERQMARLTEEQRQALDRDGYILVKGLLSPGQVEQLCQRLEQLWLEEGADAGSENYLEPGARRLANLADKGDIFRNLYAHPLVLEACRAVMGPDVRLSMLNARDARPLSEQVQPLHADTDSGGKPDERGYNACTVVWMLDPFTSENGATRMIPGSQRRAMTPKEARVDLYAPQPDEIIVCGDAGDALIFNGHCWHAGGANRTASSRRAILAHYRRGDIPLGENRRQRLSAHNAARLTPLEKEILGSP